MKKRVSPALIGVFVVAAVLLAAAMIVAFGSGQFFRDTVPVVSFFDGSVQGLRPGAPVSFRGVQVGTVKDVLLNLPDDPRLVDPQMRLEDTRIPVLYELDKQMILARGVERVDVALVDTLVQQGLRAQLGTESLVTGRLLISLDFRPEVEARLFPAGALRYPEIPTMPTPFEELQQQAAAIVDKVADVITGEEVEGLLTSVRGLVDGANEFVRSDAVSGATDQMDDLLAQLSSTARSLEILATDVDSVAVPMMASLRRRSSESAALIARTDSTLRAVQTLIDPESPLTFQLVRTLEQLGDASQALRELAGALDRNPSGILRGKATQEANR